MSIAGVLVVISGYVVGVGSARTSKIMGSAVHRWSPATCHRIRGTILVSTHKSTTGYFHIDYVSFIRPADMTQLSRSPGGRYCQPMIQPKRSSQRPLSSSRCSLCDRRCPSFCISIFFSIKFYFAAASTFEIPRCRRVTRDLFVRPGAPISHVTSGV